MSGTASEWMEPRPEGAGDDEAIRAAAEALAAAIAGNAAGAPGDGDGDGSSRRAGAHATGETGAAVGGSARAGEAADGELQSVLRAVAEGETSPTRLAMDPDGVRRGLGRLVLVVVRLLHELMEREGLRRIDAGSLTEEDIERLGLTLMRQAEEIERLREHFGLEPEDMQLDLGPLGRVF